MAPSKRPAAVKERELQSQPPIGVAGPALKFTSFNVIGYLNGKNVSSNFVKSDSQTWWSRRTNEDECEREREDKRLRLMGNEDELEKMLEAAGEGADTTGFAFDVLKSAPEGGVKPKLVKAPREEQEEDGDGDQEMREEGTSTTATVDPTTKTIVIHPGSTWLRIGRASDAFPVTVPNVIARRKKDFVPNSKGKQRAQEQELLQATAPAPFAFAAQPQPQAATAAASSSKKTVDGEDDDEDDEEEEERAADPNEPQDPLSAKIFSVRGDLRARMRIFKLRGQGNGNSTAAEYNATVEPIKTADYNDPNEIEWTDVDGSEAKEVYVGDKALKIPYPEASGYTLRRPYDRGTFNTADYTSQQEVLGDIEHIWLTTLEEELGITKTELKDYSAILLIPDLYDNIYVREMTDLVLKWIGFKQMCLFQESICSTFGAGVSNACVVDIGARITSITCIEEGMVLPETRMVLDFAGNDITEFLHTLLVRTNFPYREANLARWADYIVIEELKERMVVLSEKDVGVNLYEFYVRGPGKATLKYTMRVYDDVILAPYALFAPRVVDFERKVIPQVELWSKNVEDTYEIGSNAIVRLSSFAYSPSLSSASVLTQSTSPQTNAMRNSTRHLLPSAPSVPPPAPVASLPALPELPTASLSTSTSADPTRQSSAAPATAPGSRQSSLPPTTTAAPAIPAGGAPSLDVRLEASKIPLDVAVVESILAAGTEDRMKKICQSILIVGGTALIHNIGFAVESRVAPALAARFPSLAGQVATLPPPREIDPRILAWKGISVLSKLECANDLWVRREDWEALGMRALKERCFYFA